MRCLTSTGSPACPKISIKKINKFKISNYSYVHVLLKEMMPFWDIQYGGSNIVDPIWYREAINIACKCNIFLLLYWSSIGFKMITSRFFEIADYKSVVKIWYILTHILYTYLLSQVTFLNVLLKINHHLLKISDEILFILRLTYSLSLHARD